MKRDMDLVRAILLAIDEANDRINMDHLVPIGPGGADEQTVAYHLGMLIDEAGYVKGIKAHTFAGKNWINLDLTWAGHEFLDQVRDDDVWRKVKGAANKAGAFSIDLMAGLAKGFARAKLQQITGFDIGS